MDDMLLAVSLTLPLPPTHHDNNNNHVPVPLLMTGRRRRKEVVVERVVARTPYATSKHEDWVRDVTWSNAQVRFEAMVNNKARLPVMSKTDKVRGVAGVTSTTERQPVHQHQDSIQRSILPLRSENPNPSLYLTKAPGFISGLEYEKPLTEREHDDGDHDDHTSFPVTTVALVPTTTAPYSAYPTVDSETSPPADTVAAPPRTVWAVLDESPVDRFHLDVPNLAVKYPFELDPFQKRAVLHLERGESVFVAAHTSAGKTVVAEYAVALAFEHRTRIVYTSPIKALSNQKYRDFCEQFGKDKVGLLTGDNSVNLQAQCLIMTTEILRSMLYRGAELVRDVEFVVFDEIHYISDPERGVIWEEVIIMLPLHVHVVMLSATTPNTVEFSSWVGRNRRETVHVVSTNKRPVPLQHFLYVSGGGGGGQMFPILDSTNRLLREGWSACQKALSTPTGTTTTTTGNHSSNVSMNLKPHQPAIHKPQSQRTLSNTWLDLIKDLDGKKLLPVIVFTFSKKLVEQRATGLNTLDLSSAAEKSATHVVMNKAMQRLQEVDRQLPQIRRVADLLKRGIGIHHGGLLPILKEVVEICFTQGLVKVLIATETFAMGVNAPCRTVVFGGLRKHDGNSFRELLPGEYTQMCGRAGRRGLDSVGTVLIMCENLESLPSLDTLASMMSGRASQLASKFRLRYAMMLNLLRADEMSISGMMKRSFSEFARESLKTPISGRMKSLNGEWKEARAQLTNLMCGVQGCVSKDVEHLIRVKHDAQFALMETLQEFIHDEKFGRKAREEICRSGRCVLISPTQDLGLTLIPGVVVANASVAVDKTGDGDSIAWFVLCLLPPNFKPPLDVTYLSSAAVGHGGASTKRDIDPELAGLEMIGKRKHDDDDDDFVLRRKKGGGGGAKANQKGAPTATTTTPNTTIVGVSHIVVPDSLPRLTMASSGKFGIVRVTAKDFDKLVSDVLPITPDMAERMISRRDENEAFKLAERLLGKWDEYARYGGFLSRTLDLSKEFRVDEMNTVTRWRNEVEAAHAEICQSQCLTCPDFQTHASLAARELRLREEYMFLRNELSDENLTLFPDLTARMQVLRTMRYVDEENNDAVELKGRVACQINTADELLLTEMIFENVFENLSPAESAALLSCLVLQQKSTENIVPSTSTLDTAFRQTADIANRLLEIQSGCRVPLNSDWIEEIINPGLLNVVYEWARGKPFAALTSLTDLEEGIIVRCVTRLDETCREVKNVARVLGDPALLQKMEKASELIKRDIVFATSLYVG